MTKASQGPKIEWRKWKSPFAEEDEEQEVYSERSPNTPDLGQYPKQILSAVEREFNLWILHTNFLINEQLAAIIELTPGIETFDVVSPYRIRIGIGQLFDECDVQLSVRRNIDSAIKNNQATKKTSFMHAVNKLFGVGGEDAEKEEQ